MNLAIGASGRLGFTVELPANQPTERSGSIRAASVTLQEVPSAMCVCAGVCVWGGCTRVCVCICLLACMCVHMRFCILLPQAPWPPSPPLSALSQPGPASPLYSLNLAPSR